MGIRFSQRVRELARERKCGMVRMSLSGEYMEGKDNKYSMEFDGPANLEDFEKFRKFFYEYLNGPRQKEQP